MFSTYQSQDVTILLKDITGLVTPLGTREREARIQSGVHYSEMLPLEYEPSPAYLAAYHDALERYAGITAAELADTSGVPYLEEYDAWYTFTSDFGPGMFVCAGGEVDEAAGTARLWTEPREDGGRAELALQRDGESWHIRSHRIVNNP